MTRRLWLVGILTGCLAAMLIVPSTRWLLAAHIEQLAPFGQSQTIRLLPEPSQIRDTARSVAARHPKEYRLQLAAVCLGYTGSERVSPLLGLVDRFPDNPSLRASLLRFRCMQQVR